MLGLGLIATESSRAVERLGGSRAQWVVAGILAGALMVIGIGGLIAWLRRWQPGTVTDEPMREAAPPAGEPTRLRCPRCERQYPHGQRYCPVDAEALLHARGDAEESGDDAAGDAEAGHHHALDLSGSAMICPVCAARYQQAAAFCGRDGARLSPLN